MTASLKFGADFGRYRYRAVLSSDEITLNIFRDGENDELAVVC
ncbi:hypothetical protein [Streptomyces sp. PAL114]|nr:hypothetical protein [Streptomyces sp. PAL114]MDU0300391.1 hypothetical protein [Streptomyces sp. PAL114]